MNLFNAKSVLKWMMLVCIIAVTASCSRQKNTVLSRNYHKLTGRDNYYFNGREKVKEGAAKLAQLHTDQYDRLLKIFRYADEQKAKSVFPEMDEAIKKASIVIQRHSMIFSGEEINPWVRESYLLIGKAHFYKHDYWAAIETFQFVASSYNKELIRYDALLWLSQCYLQLGKTPDAEYLLDFMKNDKGFPWKKKQGEYYAIAADYEIQKQNLEKAGENLKLAIEATKNKKNRIRYMFILGQIYQKLGKYQEAYVLYDGVSKRNSTYEMEFNARINKARCFDISTGSREIKEQLTKMIRDEKNKDFLDQIYYALATIAQKENNENEAIELYKKSVAASTNNTNQKALSYLELAEIYFKHPDYRQAQVFYDSTIAFLSTDHPDYEVSFNKKTSLSKLVKNLNIIAAQDSLLALSALSLSERIAAVDRIIEKENEELEKQKMIEDSLKANEQQLEELPGSQSYFPGNPKQQNFNPTGSGWYFYNPSTLSFGINEFAKKWGNRKLEDNWRRSSHGNVVESGFEDELSDAADELESEALQQAMHDSIMKLDSEKRKVAYLEAIPQTAEKQQAAHDKILEAFYIVGLIYKEQLQNYPASADDFETMMMRYPENKYKLPAYYNLYRTYMAMKDTAKADVYKNILLNEYPDSEYAKLILNPNYYQENLKKTAILQVFYENTFRAYKNGQFLDVIDRKQTADSLFPPNAYTPKFAFLEALAIAKTRAMPEFEASLKKIVARYPKDSVSIRAQEILDLMYHQNQPSAPADTSASMPQPKTEVKPAPPLVPFTLRLDTVHYMLIIFPTATIDVNDLKVLISDFNQEFYSTSDLVITDGLINMDKQFVMIRSFRNSNESKSYMTNAIGNSSIFDDVDTSTLNIFTITPDNMILLMQTRDVEAYRKFFTEIYPP